MNKAASSFLLVLLIESICAIVAHLKKRLMRHLYGEDVYGMNDDPELA